MTIGLPTPGTHGDDAWRVAASLGIAPDDVLDLATSLNPVAPDIRLLVASRLSSLRRYPDVTDATRALADLIGVGPGQLLLTNGGAEAIALVAAELPEGEIVEPEFSLYRRHLEKVVPGAPRWRSNPNNPTGRLAPPDEQAGVWDEAFYPLASGSWTRGDIAAGAIVVGSLTKLLACPSLRIGYVISADEALLARIARRQPRWAVSGIVAAVLPDLLALVDLPGWHVSIAGLRKELCEVLCAKGLAYESSDAHFVLVRGAGGLRSALAPLGVVVRDCSSFGISDAVRIAVPDVRGIERLEAALELTDFSAGSWRPRTASYPAARKSASSAAAATGGERSRLAGRPRARRPAGNAFRALRGALLVCGTSSDAGKSQIVTGLCRLLAREGVSVAPFKAQNMSLNSFATRDGHEIGRAQGVQAFAAGIEAEAVMNPVLLKPTGEARSQVVVLGEPLVELDARAYQQTRRAALMPIVLGSLRELRSRFDVVVCEGAGSPAEINLLAGDIANLGLAEAAGIPALLVGDIERGGVFASIAGTFAVLPEHLSRHLHAFAINKFRGDPALLEPGISELVRLTGRECAGVI
ncbi:MAG: cobyric acid synthase, partial [Acidimicrobiales bacterium]